MHKHTHTLTHTHTHTDTHAHTHTHTHTHVRMCLTHTLTLSSHAVIKLSLRLIAKNMNFDKFKSVFTLAEQRVCTYCSFCEPVRAVVSKEKFVLKSVYAGQWDNIWHSSSVDVVQKGQLRRPKAAEKCSRWQFIHGTPNLNRARAVLYILLCICCRVVMHVYVYAPGGFVGKNMRHSKGNRGCLFQGCSTIALADRCVTVAFVALSKKKKKKKEKKI